MTTENDVDQEQQSPNPFASPTVAVATAIPDFDPNSEMREFHIGKSMARWSLVCFVSAAPSFYFGSILAREYAVQSAAMFFGILTYVAIYVYVESLDWTRRKLMDRSLRVAVWVGYVTRVVISVLFPVGMFLDMFCGMVSVSFTSAIFGLEFGPQGGNSPTDAIAVLFLWFYLTTLVQGAILNFVLGGYTLVVYAFALLFRRRPSY